MTTNDKNEGATIEDGADETGEFIRPDAALAGNGLNGSHYDVAGATPTHAQASFWLAHLENEVKRLHSKWNQIDAELKVRETRIGELREEIRARDETVARLREQIEERAETVRALEGRLAEKEERIAQLAAERRADAEQAARLQAEAADTEEQRATLERQLSAARAEMARLEAAVQREQQSATALAKRNEALVLEQRNLLGKVQDLELYVDGRHKSWSEQQAQIENYKDTLVGLEKVIKTKDAKIAKHDEERDQLTHRILELEEELAKRVRELERGVQHGMQQAKELRDELEASREQMKQLQHELARRDAELLKAGKTSAETALAVEKLTAELADSRARSEELEAKLGAAEERIAELERRREAVEGEADRLRAELAAQRERAASLEKDLGAKQATVDLLERNVHRISDLGASLAALDRQLDSRSPAGSHEHFDFGATLASDDRADESSEIVELLPPEVLMQGVDEHDGEEDAEPVVHGRGADRKLVAVINGEDVDYPLHKRHMTIGRGRTSDIRIASHYISRIHARISTHGIATVIEDAGSKNGVLVNSERVKRCVLKDGDVVSLGGELSLRFVDVRP